LQPLLSSYNRSLLVYTYSGRQLVMYAEKKSQKEAWIRALESLSSVKTDPEFDVKGVRRSTIVEMGKMVNKRAAPRNDGLPPILSVDLTPSPAVSPEIKPTISPDSCDDADGELPDALAILPIIIVSPTTRSGMKRPSNHRISAPGAITLSVPSLFL